MSGRFRTDRVEAAIAGTRFSGEITHLGSVTSTNTLALEAAQRAGSSPAPAHAWIADEQTAGRGRGGHNWHSIPGDGLYLSALVFPRVDASEGMKLALLAALCAQTAVIEITSVVPDLRWPNDLLVGGLKFGGILVESAVAAAGAPSTERPARLRYAVIGIGVNVNHTSFPEELGKVATSLRIATGQPFEREDLASALLRALDRELGLLERSGEAGPNLLARFAFASSWVQGKRVRVGGPDGYTGVTAGLDPSGFLLVEGDDGARHTVLSGGVRALNEE